jgi:hypothetical protein
MRDPPTMGGGGRRLGRCRLQEMAAGGGHQCGAEGWLLDVGRPCGGGVLPSPFPSSLALASPLHEPTKNFLVSPVN